jgi:hypothetical protein
MHVINGGARPKRWMRRATGLPTERALCPKCEALGIASGRFYVEVSGVDSDGRRLFVGRAHKTGKLYCASCRDAGREGMRGEAGLISERVKGYWLVSKVFTRAR